MACLTCVLTEKRQRGESPRWDDIYRGTHWDLAHSYNTSLLGWLVLIPHRHVEAIDALTHDESAELGLLLKAVSAALRETVDCTKTYVMQFAESVEHPHVHFHIVPRMANQLPEHKGPRIMAHLGVSDDRRVSEDEMNRIAGPIGDYLSVRFNSPKRPDS